MLHCVLIVLVFTQSWPSVLACLTRATPSVGMVACQGVPSQGWLMGAPRQATSRSTSMIHVRSRAMFVPLLLPPLSSALPSCNSLHDPKNLVDLRVVCCHTSTRLKLSAFDWRNQQCHLSRTIVWFRFSLTSFYCTWNRQHFIQHKVRIEGLLTARLPHEIIWNANLMQQGNFSDVFLARHVSGTYAHHQEHYILSCSIWFWFSAPSFWMGGGLESCCVGRVCGTDGAEQLNI